MKSKTRLWGMLFIAGFAIFGRSEVLAADDGPPASAMTLYVSFDEKIEGDFGKGELQLTTRSDHPTKKGEYVFQSGYPKTVFRIAPEKGVSAGAMECLDILPNRGRIFIPAKGNLAFSNKGWGGAVSFWINTNPDTVFKSSYCDPVQITHKGAHNGGLWIDFPNTKPRDMRMGIFPGLKAEQKPLKESDPKASIVRLPKVGFQTGEWHHLVLSWKNFDTNKPNAHAQLFVDGKLIGEIKNRDLAMNWDMDQTGIYLAVSFIGLMDEFAAFNRPLTPREITHLHKHPDALKKNPSIAKPAER